MIERALFRNSETSFIIGIGCESEFLLGADLNWNALDAFIREHEGRTLFTVINYQLGLDILDVPHPGNLLPLFRIWVPESTYLYESTRAYWLEGEYNEAHQHLAEQLLETDEQPEAVEWTAKMNK